MKKLLKWVFRLALVLVILLATLVLCRNNLAKAALERQVRNRTGMDLTIGRLSIELVSPTVTIRNLALTHTADFGGSRFLDVPELRVEYDPGGLWSRKIRLKLLRVEVGEVHVVQNKEGKTNLQALRERRKQQKAARRAGQSKTEFEGIDSLNLSLGRFKFTSDKTPASNQEIWIGARNETAKDIKSAKDLEPLIAKIALEKGVKLLADSFLDPENDSAPHARKSVENPAQKLVGGQVDLPAGKK